MARKANLTRSELVERLTGAFLESGYEGASLSRLSDATGLAKASLYHHFPDGKVDMARAVLARAGQRLQTLVLAPLMDQSQPPRDRLEASFDAVLEFYPGDQPACTMNTLLLGEGRALFAHNIAQGLSAWRGALDLAFSQMGRTDLSGEMVLDLVQGALVRGRADGGRAPLTACVGRLKAMLD